MRTAVEVEFGGRSGSSGRRLSVSVLGCPRIRIRNDCISGVRQYVTVLTAGVNIPNKLLAGRLAAMETGV